MMFFDAIVALALARDKVAPSSVVVKGLRLGLVVEGADCWFRREKKGRLFNCM